MSIVNVFVSIIVPFFIMILSTFLILQYLINKKRKLQQNIVNYNREKDFIKSVLTMDLCFLLFYFEFSCSSLYEYTSTDSSLIYYQTLTIWFYSTKFLIILQPTCKFFLYLLCNKLFRNYFISMIRCCRESSQNRQI